MRFLLDIDAIVVYEMLMRAVIGFFVYTTFNYNNVYPGLQAYLVMLFGFWCLLPGIKSEMLMREDD